MVILVLVLLYGGMGAATWIVSTYLTSLWTEQTRQENLPRAACIFGKSDEWVLNRRWGLVLHMTRNVSCTFVTPSSLVTPSSFVATAVYPMPILPSKRPIERMCPAGPRETDMYRRITVFQNLVLRCAVDGAVVYPEVANSNMSILVQSILLGLMWLFTILLSWVYVSDHRSFAFST